MAGHQAPRRIADLKPGDHLCCLYNTEDEHQALLAPYVVRGLQAGEKVLYIVHDHTPETILSYVRDEGIDPDPYVRAGQLVVITAEESYLAGGQFDPDVMIGIIRRETSKALDQGFRGLRATGEMTWSLRGRPGSERLIEYESKLNTLIPHCGCNAVCQYDRRRFDPAVLLGVVATHPIVAVGNAVYDNPYFVDPTQAKGHDILAAILDQWLNSLATHRYTHRALLQTQARYRALLERSRDATFVTRRDGTIIDFNHAARDLFQCNRTEVIGSDVVRFYADPEQRREFQREIEANGTVNGFEVRLRKVDGTVMDCLLTAWVDYTDDGEIAGYQGFVQDVTAQKRTQANLAQLAAIVAASEDAIFSKSPDGTILTWNPGAEHLFGYTANEVIGRRVTLLEPPEKRTECDAILARVRAGEHVSRLQTRRQHKDGSVIDVSVTLSPILDATGAVSGISTIARDVTLFRRAEERLQRQLQHLTALRTIDLAITGSLDLRVALGVLLDQAVHELGVDAAAVMLLDPEGLHLECAAGRGFRTSTIIGSRVRLGDGLSGRVAQERRLFSALDLSDPDLGLVRPELVTVDGFVTYHGMPLVVKGSVRGVLEVFHRRRLDPDPEWFTFLEALAGQAAVAVDNAAMFAELQRSHQDLVLAYDSTLEGWIRTLDLRDKETEGHSLRVADMAVKLARAVGVGETDMVHLRRGALLHDIGKMAIPDRILHKPGPLDAAEWAAMRRHATVAFDLLWPIRYLRPAVDIPYCHHERWDGTGYPRGLKGEVIPLAARIFAVVDVWDALRSERPYRPAWSEDEARQYILSAAGSHFDPRVVDVFRRLFLEQPPLEPGPLTT